MIHLLIYLYRELVQGGADPPAPARRAPVDPSTSRDPAHGRSRLSAAQHKLLAVVVGLGVAMGADTLYLLANRAADALELGYFAVTEISLPRIYQALVLSHTGLGIALVALALGFVEWHLPRVWRRQRRRAIATGLVTVGLGLTLLVTGLFVLTEANSRQNAWAWWSHVAAAAGLPALYLMHRRSSIWKPSAVSYRVVPAAIAGLAVVAIAVHGISYDEEAYTEVAQRAFAAGTHTGPGSRQRELGGGGATFVPASFVPFQSPFFPSAATTTTGTYLPSRIITRGGLPDPERLGREIDRQGFVVEERIGADACARCHAAIVDQWASSAHRFASFNNPFYEATINDLRANATTTNGEVSAHIAHFTGLAQAEGGRDLAGREALVKSKWCSGCHDPALMLAGQMSGPIDRRTPQAQAGLTCLACHAIDHIHNTTGNGNYNIADEQEDPYLFPEAEGGVARTLHDMAVKARPTVHKRQMLKPFFREAEFCATCHKVSLDTRLNDYRWLRGQNEYDNWHDSGVALNASRTFYLPGFKRVCQDCHMPMEEAVGGDVSARDGYVKSHRFVAVNTALPHLRGDTDAIRRTEAFLRDQKLRVDIPAVRRADGQLVYLPDRAPPAVVPGEHLEVEVAVRNLGVGHTFPGGTNDSNEGWLEVATLDADGRVLTRNGAVRGDGHVDPTAHFYKALIVDRHGAAIHKRNAQDIYAPVYVRVIGPGTADVAHYAVEVPADYRGASLRIRARLLWRKFDRAYTEFAYRANPEGFRAFADVPDLPVTEIAACQLVLPVGEALSPNGPVSAAPPWQRLNDYGIGLFLQGDSRGATAAFAQVGSLAPERVDGPRNLARVALQDGDLTLAYEHLRRCEELAPGDGQTAWVWGLTHQANGLYGDAELAYRHLLQRFPEDRAAWRNLGRVLYLDGRYAEALEALDEALAIDPEDRGAQYHRMLGLRALGRDEEADAAAAAYEYYQIDESAQEVTRQYRLRHEHDNRETQPIHRHELAPAGTEGV